jgi:hypothetical protein
VYTQVDLLEKKRLELQQCSRAQKPVAPCSGEGWAFYGGFNSRLGYGLGGFFPLAMDLRMWTLFDELACLLLIGGEQPWENPIYQPHGRFMRPCLSSSVCRAHRALHGGWDTDSLVCLLGLQTQQCLLLPEPSSHCVSPLPHPLGCLNFPDIQDPQAFPNNRACPSHFYFCFPFPPSHLISLCWGSWNCWVWMTPDSLVLTYINTGKRVSLTALF